MGQDHDAVVAASTPLIVRGQAADAAALPHGRPGTAGDRTAHLLRGDSCRAAGDLTAALAAYRAAAGNGTRGPV